MDNFKLKVGDGNSFKFWTDRWCANTCLKEEFPGLYRLSVEKEETLRMIYEKKDISGVWILQF